MSDWDDLVASLPDPTTDPMPPRKALTEAEIRRIRDQKRGEKKKRGRRDWSNRAEMMMVRILEGAFEAANVTREADRMQGYQDKDGEWHHFYANRGKPDITFAVLHNGTLVEGAMEVKSVAPSSAGLDVTETNIKPWQIRTMEKHPDRLNLWGIVFWTSVGNARCFVVTHERFMEIVNEDLKYRARHDGRFQGKSLRRKRDLDLLGDCEIEKTNRWLVPEGHWWYNE